MYNYHIIAIDDNVALLQTLKLILKDTFKKVGSVSSPTLITAILNNGDVDAVLLDMNFSNTNLNCEEGLFWLNNIKQRPNAPAVILMTAFGDIDIAVRSMKYGADDFITKPWDNKELIEKLVTAIEKHDVVSEVQTPHEEKEEEATIEEMEKEKIKKTLRETERNITLAAKLLGISRRTLYINITKYGL